MSEKIALFDETLLTESMLHLSANVLKVNKSVYIASRTYRFCWQYAIILEWKTWSSVNSVKFY